MADVTTNAQTRLEGNSVLANKQYDKNSHELLGFDINNPNGSVLHIDVSEYSRRQEVPASASKFREEVYENYKTLVENVPAATAVFESNAREFPLGVVWQNPQMPGLWNMAPPGKGDSTESPQNRPMIMTGNLKLPEGADPIRSAGGGNADDAKAQDYLGKDGRWHKQISAEALLHEHVHGTREEQNWLSTRAQTEKNAKAGIEIPSDNLKEVMRLENEGRAIEFVNKTMMVPAGIAERAPEAYRAIKPSTVTAPSRGEYTEQEKEKLRQGPIPPGLEAYSHPVAVPVQKSSLLEGGAMSRLSADELAIVAARVHENVSNQVARGEGLPLPVKGMVVQEGAVQSQSQLERG